MTQVNVTLATPARMRVDGGALSLPDALPLLLIASIAVLSFAINRWVHIGWIVPAYRMIWPAIPCFALALFYFITRRNAAFQEAWFYLGLWILYPILVARITYLAAWLSFPLRDELFVKLDAMLGFDWVTWTHFLMAHPLLMRVQDFAYGSFFWQPPLTVLVLAFGPLRGRNSEFLTSVLLSVCLVTFTFMLLPTIGPAEHGGVNALQTEIIHALRSGFHGPYIYYGIISFPSFHICMAILCTLAHRGSKPTFPPVFMLNLVMLSAIPYLGDHYLSDLIAGAFIAVTAFFATRFLHRKLLARAAISGEQAA